MNIRQIGCRRTSPQGASDTGFQADESGNFSLRFGEIEAWAPDTVRRSGGRPVGRTLLSFSDKTVRGGRISSGVILAGLCLC